MEEGDDRDELEHRLQLVQSQYYQMRKLLASIFIIVLLYYGTLLLFGQKVLANQLRDNTNATWNKFKWTNAINVISNLDLKIISKIFNDSSVKVNSIKANEFEDVAEEYFKKDTYSYYVIVNSKCLPYIRIDESEHIEDYAAVWERKYIWCFFFWIKMQDEMTGIS